MVITENQNLVSIREQIRNAHGINQENYILDALEIVSAWDLPESELADAVNDQARLMAGFNPDELCERHPETI